jgi:hypothetical protein
MKLPKVSAEAAMLQNEVAQLAEWLAAQGLDLHSDRAHLGEGSRDRLYWRYGYFAGLQKALMLFEDRAATLNPSRNA